MKQYKHKHNDRRIRITLKWFKLKNSIFVLFILLSLSNALHQFNLELNICGGSQYHNNSHTKLDIVNAFKLAQTNALVPNTEGPTYLKDDGTKITFIENYDQLNCTPGSYSEHAKVPIRSQQTSINSMYFGKLLENGYLKYDNFYYSPSEYCISSLNEDENNLELFICKKTCHVNNINVKSNNGLPTKMTTCLPKCCEINQLLVSAPYYSNCITIYNESEYWNPKLYQNTFPHVQLTEEQQNKINIHILYSPLYHTCGQYNGFILYQKDFPQNPKVPFKILEDGRAYYQNSLENKWDYLEEGTYCFDGIYESEATTEYSSANDTGEEQTNNLIYYCPRFLPEGPSIKGIDKISYVYFITTIASAIFLLLTIIIHIFTLRLYNIHGWALLCFLVSLFCLYIVLAMLHCTRLFLDKDPKSIFCWSIGVSLHFLYLSTFTWLTVVNTDLWLAFRSFKNLVATRPRKRRFILYTIFGFGVPIIVLIISLILDTYSRNVSYSFSKDGFIPPGYGQNGCFFSSDSASFLYLYGPIGILLLFNIFLFILTVNSMYKHKKSSSFASCRRSSNNPSQPKQSFHLFLKLFVLMGVLWIFEIISWAAHPETIPWYWAIFDMINICQGIFIFLIFISKKSVFSG